MKDFLVAGSDASLVSRLDAAKELIRLIQQQGNTPSPLLLGSATKQTINQPPAGLVLLSAAVTISKMESEIPRYCPALVLLFIITIYTVFPLHYFCLHLRKYTIHTIYNYNGLTDSLETIFPESSGPPVHY